MLRKNNITNINIEKEAINSREVAKQTNETHSHVMRKIDSLVGYIKPEPKLVSADYFIKSTYKDKNNQSRSCYLLTRLGCEMYVNKLSGRKGTLFTAFYVQKFHEMDEQLKLQNQDSYMIDDPVKRAEKWIQEQNERKQLEADNKKLKPKATYYDHQLSMENGIKTSVIAQNYVMSAVKFNRLLHNLGIQYKVGKNWLLYKKYQDKGYIVQREFNYAEDKIATTMLWTPKGKKFLYDMLKENGIVPENEVNVTLPGKLD
ncbi:phage antirepressor KilAC domain-containing protein [Apilactobacillus micheneri]|uniref:phage antirepressor KilAC domain-containing protein n=1 Tax=Apilactobacillus micheneri TaxID=1899430 RepID=UPI00142E23DA|nr:phage regulatory protein/antirepressor Ant [Apilactobacillus micheneri]